MAIDVLFTDGVIAAREKYLLKDKIFKLCEAGAEEALRALTESGFGKGAEVNSVYDFEQLVAADEAATDAFIREYAPARAEREYLLSPRDFHNAKALIKAHYLGADAAKMLAPAGLVPVQVIEAAIKSGDNSALSGGLKAAVEEARALFDGAEDKESVSGAQIGAIFERAQFEHLARVCRTNPLLKKLIAVRADMTNILTALRSAERENAEKAYLKGGRLSAAKLSGIFDGDAERAESCLDGTAYAEFYKKCLADRRAGQPLTAAERALESYETEYFAERKYELSGKQPFLYYVFRRRAENANVRILFVCLLADMKDYEIKARLRAF